MDLDVTSFILANSIQTFQTYSFHCHQPVVILIVTWARSFQVTWRDSTSFHSRIWLRFDVKAA